MLVAGIMESNNGDGLIFVDNKRRCVQERKVMGRPNIEMDQPLWIQNLDQEDVTVVDQGEEVTSKNEILEGTRIGARQASWVYWVGIVVGLGTHKLFSLRK